MLRPSAFIAIRSCIGVSNDPDARMRSVNSQMEVVHERLVAGHRLERVVVREREHGLPRRFAGVRAHVEVHRPSAATCRAAR